VNSDFVAMCFYYQIRSNSIGFEESTQLFDYGFVHSFAAASEMDSVELLLLAVNVAWVNQEDRRYVEDSFLGERDQHLQGNDDFVVVNLLPMAAVTMTDMKLYTEVDDKPVAAAVGKEVERENAFRRYSGASRTHFEHVALTHCEVSQSNGLRREQYASSLVEVRLVVWVTAGQSAADESVEGQEARGCSYYLALRRRRERQQMGKNG
jgi:hypothetical protein